MWTVAIIKIGVDYHIADSAKLPYTKYISVCNYVVNYYICKHMYMYHVYMIVKRFGCTAIHNKTLYKFIIHLFIHSYDLGSLEETVSCIILLGDIHYKSMEILFHVSKKQNNLLKWIMSNVISQSAFKPQKYISKTAWTIRHIMSHLPQEGHSLYIRSIV